MTRIVYMGTPEFAVLPLRALLADEFEIVGVVSQPDRPQGRHYRTVPTPVKRVAKKHQIPVFQPETLKDGQLAQQLSRLKPDLIVTAAYGKILSAEILAIPRHGCLNIHASLLPRYRGAAPIQWSLINGDAVSGITVMLMDEGMDTGAVLAQKTLKLDDSINAEELTAQLAELGASVIGDVIRDWLAGRIEPKAQDETKACVVKPLTRQMGEIDWTGSAESIHNLIRGLYPWPGTFTWCSDKRLKVFRSRINRDGQLKLAAERNLPGTICSCQKDAISVVCGTGVIDLLEIQSESGKRVSCKDCAHNYRLGQMMGDTK